MAKTEPTSSTKPSIKDAESDRMPSQYKKQAMVNEPDSYNDLTPLDVEHNEGQDDGSGWGDELQNQDSPDSGGNDEDQDGGDDE